MNAAQRIRVIRLIEKIDKNPEFSNKIGVKNISEFTTEMQKKKWKRMPEIMILLCAAVEMVH